MSRRSKKEVEAIVSGMGVFVSIISSLVELVKKFGGTMENIYRLATPEGSATLEKIAQMIVRGVEKVQNEFLRLIFAGENLTLDECDGSEVLADASDVFASIDLDFKNWNADEQGMATGETPIAVHELVKDANFSQIFGSLSPDVSRLCLTQAQIKNFVKKYRDWIRKDGYATLFLFKSNNQFFVAY
ncbi:MAG: hypothetical protein M0P97_03210, partial [Candidatus Moranbacteria bacterium]|nr:hypothetical protein [Candidatus Moranbacteria bacterium]